MAMIPYVRESVPEYGRLYQVSPLIQRVVAENPGPFTYTGTGTYIVGRADADSTVAVIDPGPCDKPHLAALLKAVADRRVTHVLVTHTHRDHSPLARSFAEATGATVAAAQPTLIITHASGPLEEDGDQTFAPDVVQIGGERVSGDGWTLEAMATPGHASNHMAYALLEEKALFSGDHVMGWATSVIAAPDGDMATYLDSLDRVIARGFETLWPTHGAPITQPEPFLQALKQHRLDREAQIVARLAGGDISIRDMVPVLYATVDQRLWPAASLSVLSHLKKLADEGRVGVEGEAALDGRWTLTR